MTTRAIWKGHLGVGELSCAVSLHAAATTSERISFHIVNRRTGNRVRRQYLDEETGKPVDRDDQVKGWETTKGSYVVLEPEEIAAAVSLHGIGRSGRVAMDNLKGSHTTGV